MATVPIFAPDGTLGDVPYEQFHAALAAGAKPGVTVKAPDGTLGVVPADRYQEAARAGAKIVPFEQQETQHPGFWSTLGEDLKGMLHPGGFSPYPGMDVEAKSAAAQESANQNAARKQAGYSLPYRALAPVAQAVGTNVPGMEEAAAAGDAGAVLGHAAAPLAAVGAGEALAHGVPAAIEAAPAAVRATAKGVNTVLAKAPATVGTAVGGAAGALTHLPYAPEVGAGIGAVVGKELLPKLRVPGEKFGLPKIAEDIPEDVPESAGEASATPRETQASPAPRAPTIAQATAPIERPVMAAHEALPSPGAQLKSRLGDLTEPTDAATLKDRLDELDNPSDAATLKDRLDEVNNPTDAATLKARLADLQQPVHDIVDAAIPPETDRGANLLTKARIDFQLKRGDVEAAQKVLEQAKLPANQQVRGGAQTVNDQAAMDTINRDLEAKGISPADGPLYHGAPVEAAEDIKANGLRSDEGRVYLTPDKQAAMAYGKAKSPSGQAVVIEVDPKQATEWGYQGMERRSPGSIPASALSFPPEGGRQIVPATQNIRENDAMAASAEAEPRRYGSADAAEDRALEQEMQWDLEKEGYRVESQARREFIARNSTGATKTELNKQFDQAMGKPAKPEPPVKYTKTPGVKAIPPGAKPLKDYTPVLQRMLDEARKKKAGE